MAAIVKPIMRTGLVLGIFLATNFVAAGTLEDCTFEGDFRGEKIILHWIYNYQTKSDGFSKAKSQIYGFCSFVQTEKDPDSGLTCYETDGGEKTVHYQHREANEFVCDQGCEKGAAKILKLICEVTDDC